MDTRFEVASILLDTAEKYKFEALKPCQLSLWEETTPGENTQVFSHESIAKIEPRNSEVKTLTVMRVASHATLANQFFLLFCQKEAELHISY